jgi:outer membrane protein assembly factor BamA
MKERTSVSPILPRIVAVILFLLFFTVEAQAQKQKRLKEPELAAVPLISYNKSFGGIFGAFGSLYFPLSSADTISPASFAGGGGMITTNKTWFGFGFAKLFYSEDRFRTAVAAGTGTMNFQYYNEETGAGMFIGYSTVTNFFVVEQLVRVLDHIYTGLDFISYSVKTTFEQGASDSLKRRYIALGIPLSYDSRDNVLNPSNGWFANARFNRYDSAFGSAAEYTKLDLDGANFSGPDTAHVFASKVSLSTGLGTIPFEAKTVVGGRVLRGYSEGKYRGDQVYAIQGEYRWNFTGPWGAVFFGGVATPVNKDETWSTSDILPAAGAGIRYMLLPDLRINVGFDAAIGKGDYGIYFRIGEAF